MHVILKKKIDFHDRLQYDLSAWTLTVKHNKCHKNLHICKKKKMLVPDSLFS